LVRATFSEIRERLAELDRLDSGRKVFGSDKHQYRLNPPLSMNRVEQIETLIGVRLPDQYRRFATEFADGGAGPGARGILSLERLLTPGRDRSWLADLARPFPAPTTVDESHVPAYSEEAGTDPIFEAALASPDSLRLEFVDWYVKWLDESLWVASRPPRR
jgi:hypothetical protein